MFWVVVSLTGCNSLKTRDQQKRPQPTRPTPSTRTGDIPRQTESPLELPTEQTPTQTTTQAPPPQPSPPPPTAPIATATPLPPKVYPKIGVILGPGGMKTFAHLGVLREMNRARIPVHAIVGLEWGAVMAGAFAASGQINDAEWKAYKLREVELPGSGLLSRDISAAPISKLMPFLEAAFGSTPVDRAKIDFACPAVSKGAATVSWLNKGSLKDAVAKCVPYSPLYQDNGGWIASPFSVDDAAAWLRSRGANVILLVDVLGQGEYLPSKSASDLSPENLIWSEIRRELYRARPPEVNHVIHVNTTGRPVTDFNGRRELMDAGLKAATDPLNKMVSQYGF